MTAMQTEQHTQRSTAAEVVATQAMTMMVTFKVTLLESVSLSESTQTGWSVYSASVQLAVVSKERNFTE